MQPRELTPEEIAEGRRGITDEKLSATQIQALVRAMDQSKKRWAHKKHRARAEYLQHLKAENEKLYFNYPGIFDMHAEDKLDVTFFEMLALKRKIERGEMTTEQASAIVGQQMFNRFVPQSLNPSATPQAPRMSYEDYYKQFGEMG
jgi:hypothetical protein